MIQLPKEENARKAYIHTQSSGKKEQELVCFLTVHFTTELDVPYCMPHFRKDINKVEYSRAARMVSGLEIRSSQGNDGKKNWRLHLQKENLEKITI